MALSARALATGSNTVAHGKSLIVPSSVTPPFTKFFLPANTPHIPASRYASCANAGWRANDTTGGNTRNVIQFARPLRRARPGGDPVQGPGHRGNRRGIPTRYHRREPTGLVGRSAKLLAPPISER